jgi:hypothetical protein
MASAGCGTVSVAAHFATYHGRVILTPVHIEHTGRNGPETSSVGGKIYRAAKPGEGFRWDTADGAQRRAQIARQRRRYAQRRLEEERNSPELAREPSFIGRVWGRDSTLHLPAWPSLLVDQSNLGQRVDALARGL